MTFVCNEGTQGGGLQKCNHTTSLSLTIKGKILTSHTIGVISMCKSYEIFMKMLLFALYILPFLSIHDRIYISLAHAFLEQNFLRRSSLFNKISERQHDLRSADN